jgi:alpha-ketoglutarate-dependent taurine dioxygenase
VSTIVVEQTGKSIGAEISGIEPDDLLKDESAVVTVTDALETNGVIVFRNLNLEPEAQVRFCERIGEVDYSEGHHPVPGIYRVTRDAAKNSAAEYLKGTFHWHIDGCTPLHGEPPQKATMLSAKAVAESGGETEFASTYAAYEALSDDEKERFASLRVLHSLEASQRLVYPDPTAEQIQGWRLRPTSVHPLVWTHRSGRKSLLISAHADHIVDMDPEESRALLDELMGRATKEEFVYRHRWSVGDSVIWDNTGVMHRSTPYAAGSPREMLRTAIFGTEPIQ